MQKLEKEACEADGGTWDGTTCKKEDTETDEPETNDAETTCVNNGGTWDGSACTYPTTPDPEPTPDPSVPEGNSLNPTGYVWYDRRSLYNIFDRL